MSTAQRKPKSGALDVLLGQRIRSLRLERGMSQTALADQIGITFQQVQKYESGANRISATTLVRLAEGLGVTAVTLLASLDESAGRESAEVDSERLVAAFARVTSPELRAAILAIVISLADGPSHVGATAMRSILSGI